MVTVLRDFEVENSRVRESKYKSESLGGNGGTWMRVKTEGKGYPLPHIINPHIVSVDSYCQMSSAR